MAELLPLSCPLCSLRIKNTLGKKWTKCPKLAMMLLSPGLWASVIVFEKNDTVYINYSYLSSQKLVPVVRSVLSKFPRPLSRLRISEHAYTAWALAHLLQNSHLSLIY